MANEFDVSSRAGSSDARPAVGIRPEPLNLNSPQSVSHALRSPSVEEAASNTNCVATPSPGDSGPPGGSTSSGSRGVKRVRTSWVYKLGHMIIKENWTDKNGVVHSERAFCNYCDIDYACKANSGTGALERHLRKKHPNEITEGSGDGTNHTGNSDFVYSKLEMRVGLARYVAAAEQPFMLFLKRTTYEEFRLNEKDVGDKSHKTKWMKEGMDCTLLFFKGKVIGFELPISVKLKVVDADRGLKGDTAQGGSKLATLEMGAVVNAPLFVETCQEIMVDSRTGQYMSHV